MTWTETFYICAVVLMGQISGAAIAYHVIKWKWKIEDQIQEEMRNED